MFADRLKTVLHEQFISQADLSKATGISKARISMYCAGASRPRPQALKQIADALHVPAGWLIGEIKEKEPSLAVSTAAKALGMLPQCLREGLKARSFPFGYAILKNGKFKYYINPTQFGEYKTRFERNLRQ